MPEPKLTVLSIMVLLADRDQAGHLLPLAADISVIFVMDLDGLSATPRSLAPIAVADKGLLPDLLPGA
jgi:hypothetical protein